jgi:gliding motility-associated-like protein
MKKIFLFISVLFLLSSIVAQENWKAEFKKRKVFIENKGQFDEYNSNEFGKVKYAVDFGNTRILFSEKGVKYSLLESSLVPKEKRQELASKLNASTISDFKKQEKLVGKFLFKSENVTLLWSNALPCKIISENKTTDYHSYTFKGKDGKYTNESNIAGYEKIIYKNIYPNIDIEYTVHPESGVKYALILNPGANPTDVKMVYDKAVKLENGKVLIPTIFGDIIDHEPFTFYASSKTESVKKEITSSFVQLDPFTIQFQLSEYSSSKKVIIDPWTQTPAFATNWDCVWECERDGSGNAYALGGVMPMQILKYNAAGTLQWTYNTPYDTSNVWLGTFAVDNSGNSYVTAGSTAQIQKIGPAGALIWNNASPTGAFSNGEFWTISFNCDQSKLVVGGTGGAALTLKATVYDINVNTGAVITSADFAQGSTFGFPPSVQEVRAICTSPSGKYYFMTQDTVGAFSQNFSLCSGTPLLYKIDNSYDLGYKCENYRYDNAGICAIKANNNFYYTQNGSNVHKRNLQTGVIISTVAIPGGASTTALGDFSVSNSGIDIDDCGNVYVGSSNGVVKYDANLTQLAFYPTSFKVYDVHVSTSGDIIAGGSTGNSSNAIRTGYIQTFAASACAPLVASCCDATICPVQSVCETDAPLTLTAATAGGTWSGNGVNASGVFDPTVSGAGIQQITYTLPCGSETISINVSPCQALTACVESNGSVTVSNGIAPYNWAYYQAATTTPITNQTECQSCGYTWFGFQCLNGFTPANSCNSPAQWVNFSTGTNATIPAGNSQVQVTDNSGTITVLTIANLPNCTTNPCPTITVTTQAQTNVLCFGGTNGTSTVTATGGTGPYSYSWNPGNLSGATQSNLTAGTYTVTSTDNANCTGTIQVIITQPTVLQVAQGNITPANCGSSDGSVSVSASGGTAGYTYAWSPSGGNAATATNLSAGNYSVTVTDANNCIQTLPVTINSSGGPNIDQVDVVNVTCFGESTGAITVTASPFTPGTEPLQYQINNGNQQSSSVFTGLTAGNYSITVTDINNCPNTQLVTISQPNQLTVNAGPDVAVCSGEMSNLNAIASGGTGTIFYLWSDGQNIPSIQFYPISSGIFQVDVYDINGCTESDSIYISIIPCGPLEIEIPNVFSPNNDGSNDEYGITTLNALYQEAVILDRWGIKMIELNSPNQLWNGKIPNGKEATEGVYFLKYRVVGANGEEKIGHTFFHLIR